MQEFFKEAIRHIFPYRCIRLFRRTANHVTSGLVFHKDLKELNRMRTEAELDLQSRALIEVREILNLNKIPYFIMGGALLGSIREGDFIRWDYDVDIEVKTEEIKPKHELLMSLLIKAGFQITFHDSSWTDYKIIASKHGINYEITGYMKMRGLRYRKRSFHPDFKDGGEIILRGEKYSTFLFPEKYLDWFYGDWKKPKQTVIVDDYITTKSRTSPLALTCLEIMSLFKK